MAFGEPPSPPPPPASRYAYLVARLRHRQITMEEATELFGIMDETIHRLRTEVIRTPPPPPPQPAMGPAMPPPTPGEPKGGPPAISTDDLLTAGVLMIGAGAGIAAALKRKAEMGRSSGPAAAPTGDGQTGRGT